MEPEQESASSVPAWFVTFADMMTLLLTFFIMLASMSELKTEKLYQSMAQSMRRKFGSEAELVSLVSDGTRGNANLQGLASIGRSRRAGLMRSDDKGQATEAAPDGEPRPCGAVSFPDGASDLTPADRRRLQSVAEKLRPGIEIIELRGHTSQRAIPLHSPYRDQWDLAYARCRKTMDLLVSTGIDPKRIRIGVTAEQKVDNSEDSAVPNRSDEASQRTEASVELWIVSRQLANLTPATITQSASKPIRK